MVQRLSRGKSYTSKKDVFIESFEGHKQDHIKEEVANNFSSDYLLPESFIQLLPEGRISENEIRKIARAYDTHPTIVLGRLYKLGKVPYSLVRK